MTLKAPELLLPAGSGQDARCLRLRRRRRLCRPARYSLRARNNEFRLEQIAQGIQEARARQSSSSPAT